MAILFALLAALSNAVNEATQHIASTAAPARSSGWRLVIYLFRNPLWLFGWGGPDRGVPMLKVQVGAMVDRLGDPSPRHRSLLPMATPVTRLS